jgi:Flp pilus assembly protein TadG
METAMFKSLLRNTFFNRFSRLVAYSNRKGQAAVEFTLTFVLLLIIAWIPADFGLAFFTGQQAQNAAREGARIASADPTLVAQMGGATSINCTAPCSGAPSVLQAAAARLSNVLIKNAAITLSYDPAVAGCQKTLSVRVQGTYNYFFFQLLRLVGVTGNYLNSTNIDRLTSMRYEHQTPCNPF